MKYENASDVLPQELLNEVRKYAAGKLLYIPSGDEKKAWGEATGYRDKLNKRNLVIRNKYAHGITVMELADEYFLSLDSIKKIIYSRRNIDNHPYAPTVLSAVQFANAGMFEEWVQCYLQITKRDTPFAHELWKEDPVYFGVVKLPLRLIQKDGLDIRGEQAGDFTPNMNILPPLLVQFKGGKFYCTVDRELLATLKQHKVNAYPTIIVLQNKGDYKMFKKHYEGILFFVDDHDEHK